MTGMTIRTASTKQDRLKAPKVKLVGKFPDLLGSYDHYGCLTLEDNLEIVEKRDFIIADLFEQALRECVSLNQFSLVEGSPCLQVFSRFEPRISIDFYTSKNPSRGAGHSCILGS